MYVALIASICRFPIGLRHSKVLEAMLADCNDEHSSFIGQLAIKSAPEHSSPDVKMGSEGYERSSEQPANDDATPGSMSDVVRPASTRSNLTPFTSPSISIKPKINGFNHNGHATSKPESAPHRDIKYESPEVVIANGHHQLNGAGLKQTSSHASAVQA